MKFESEYKSFPSRKCLWKVRLRNHDGGHFLQVRWVNSVCSSGAISVNMASTIASSLAHYLNQCWPIGNWATRNKLQSKCIHFHKKNVHENVVRKMIGICPGFDISKYLKFISMALCKTAATPLLTHWSYCSLALSHRYDLIGYLIRKARSFTIWFTVRHLACLLM